VRGCWVLSSTRADGRLRKVAAAVVNWNDLQRSLRCLASINEVGPGSQLILVDNGSAADPTSDVKAQAPYRDALYHAGTRAALDFFRNRWGAYPMPVPNGDSGAASSVAVGQ